MPEDQLPQLLLRVRYLERALAIQKDDYLTRKKSYDSIIQKLRSMIKEGEIKTHLSIDSIYYHLLEKLDLGEPDLDKHAAEIRDFIA